MLLMKTLISLVALAIILALFSQLAPPVSAFVSPGVQPPPPRPTPPTPQGGAHRHHERHEGAGVVVATVEAKWDPLAVWYQVGPNDSY